MNGRIIYQKDDEASLREMKALNAPSKLRSFDLLGGLNDLHCALFPESWPVRAREQPGSVQTCGVWMFLQKLAYVSS